jgi:hypothetical protein
MTSDVHAVIAQNAPPARPPIAAPIAAPAPVPEAGAGLHIGDDWAQRADALRARPDDVGVIGATAWSDVALGPLSPLGPLGAAAVSDRTVRSRLVAALAAALATCGPEPVRSTPRVGLVVGTPAGPVVTTFTAPHTLAPHDLDALVDAAERQVAAGHVDVRFLAPPDVTLTCAPQVDRLALPVPRGALVAVGIGAVAARAVATPDGIGLRTTVTVSATADPARLDATGLSTLLATAVAALSGRARVEISPPS